jgi:uncharacterized protein
MSLILGYIGALIMGITLGIMGGGGSILTVPILVYLFKIETQLATKYSLFIVGTTSLVGSITYFKKKNIDFKTALYFGTASILTVFTTRYYLLPHIPPTICQIGNTPISKNTILLLLFAILMLAASYSMINTNEEHPEGLPNPKNNIKLIPRGIAVGLVTGLIGAGGGFLIIPALVIFAKIPIKRAIGTSLFIITVNSLIGFLSDNTTKISTIDWNFLSLFSGIAITGILLGTYLSKYVSNQKLKPSFGYFILIMGIYILYKEIFSHL